MASLAGSRLVARVGPYAVAAFVSLHLLAVLVHVVPYPTHRTSALNKILDAREEVDHALHTIHGLLGQPGTFRVFKRRTLALADGYATGVMRARGVVAPYLTTVGSSQRWNMFGGVPPRHPIVGMIDVSECGSRHKKFRNWLDGHAGASGDAVFDFRHRKAQETLYLAPKSSRRSYARYWIRRWEAEHPGRRLRALRFSYLETTTPPAAAIGKRKGDKRRGRVTVSQDKVCRR